MAGPSDVNPYESPRAEPSPAQRVARRVSVWLAAPLTLAAMAVAFCCTCFPSGYAAGMLAYGLSNPSSPWAWLVYPLMALPWLIGLAAAVFVGRRLWRAFSRSADGG